MPKEKNSFNARVPRKQMAFLLESRLEAQACLLLSLLLMLLFLEYGGESCSVDPDIVVVVDRIVTAEGELMKVPVLEEGLPTMNKETSQTEFGQQMHSGDLPW